MPNRYGKLSPYYKTPTVSNYLGIMVNRPIPKKPDDEVFSINDIYQYRPDLLAFDLYKSSDLWWVFAQRNPNILQDPIGDFQSGTRIYLPQLSTLRTVLGF